MAAAATRPRLAFASSLASPRVGASHGPAVRLHRDGRVIPEWLGQVTERANIITLAIIGAGLASLGADAVAHRLRIGPRLARWLIRCGHTAMWTSVALFVIAGFLPVG